MPWQSPYTRKRKQEPQTQIFGGELDDTPDMKVLMPQWAFKPPYGRTRFMRNGEVFNPSEIRLLGSSTAVWQCKKRIADAIVTANWDILPTNPKTPNSEEIEKVKEKFRHPNTNKETWNNITFSTIMDVLDLDAGIIVNVFGKYNKNKLVQFYSRDGATIIKETDEYGRITQYWQYDYQTMTPIALQTKEVAYVSINTKSDSVYGESPVETLRLVVRSLVKGVQTQELIYRKGGIPSGVMAFEGMNKDDFEKFKSWWETKMKGKVYKQAMVNIPPSGTGAKGEVKWIPLITSFSDLQFLDSQKWFTELVYRTFGVPHYGLGTGVREAKGVSSEERAKFLRETIAPYLIGLEQAINQQIMPYLSDQCYFHYTILDTLQEMEEIELWAKRWENGAFTINEYRKGKGLTELPWGDYNPMMMKTIQQVSQAWWYGAFDSDAYTKLTGIETPQEQIRTALKTKTEEKTNE